MTTSIVITPPGGTAITLQSYDQCNVNYSATNRAGTFSLKFRATDSVLVDSLPVGSDVVITQDGHVFRGWIINPQKGLDTNIRTFSVEGSDYTAKTQKIIVTESYISTAIDAIVKNLIATYIPWATDVKVDSFPTAITIKFDDKFMWDVMDQLCQLSGAEWYIDESLVVNFFLPSNRINTNVISQSSSNYKKGSANLKPNSSKLVNKLWVKGGKALSNDFTQNITVSGTTPIPLYYTPHATTTGVIITIGGVTKTVGIENVDASGTKDFLMNFSEKLLIPDLVTTGTGTIIYQYEYPIKILLEEPNSQAQHGVFEDVYNVQTNDRTIALDLGLKYLSKYSQPVISGSIEPYHGIYRPGELVKIEIPDINVNDYLQVKSIAYDSVPLKPIVRRLQIESIERNLTIVMKDINSRLQKLEASINQDSTGPIDRYIARDESWGWSEVVTETVYACPVPSTSLYPSSTLYPC